MFVTSTSKVCLAGSLSGLDLIGQAQRRPAAVAASAAVTSAAETAFRTPAAVKFRNAPHVFANVESQEIHCWIGGFHCFILHTYSIYSLLFLKLLLININ